MYAMKHVGKRALSIHKYVYLHLPMSAYDTILRKFGVKFSKSQTDVCNCRDRISTYSEGLGFSERLGFHCCEPYRAEIINTMRSEMDFIHYVDYGLQLTRSQAAQIPASY